MTGANTLVAARIGWLVLCGMMLFSRFVFQAAGPVWMRSFLDGWKVSKTRRAWGWLACLFGLFLMTHVARAWETFLWTDRALAVSLCGVLVADGLLNLAPGWFGHFKERMQAAWVKRNPGERGGDAHLFGTVNFFLGFASVAAAAFVCLYRPLEARWLLWSSLIAVALMAVLVISSRVEQRTRAGPPS